MDPVRPTIRQATESDYQHIVQLHGKEGFSPWNPFTSAEKLSELPQVGLLVAEVNNQFAGYLYWYSGAKPPNDYHVDRFALISEVEVNNKFPPWFTYWALVTGALKKMEEEKYPVVYVQISDTDTKLRDVYEKIGFTRVDRILHLRYLYPDNPNRTEIPKEEALELTVFMVELAEQCRIVFVAYDDLRYLIEQGPPEAEDDKREFSAMIWARLQSILSTASIISRILWPNTKPRKDGSDKLQIKRALELRRRLNLQGEKSPFPNLVRNAFEHIDERISEWLPGHSGDERHMPWGWSISAFDERNEPGDSSQALRYFNIYSTKLRVAGESCYLNQVVYSVSQINSKIPSDAKIMFGDAKDWDPEKRDRKDGM